MQFKSYFVEEITSRPTFCAHIIMDDDHHVIEINSLRAFSTNKPNLLTRRKIKNAVFGYKNWAWVFKADGDEEDVNVSVNDSPLDIPQRNNTIECSYGLSAIVIRVQRERDKRLLSIKSTYQHRQIETRIEIESAEERREAISLLEDINSCLKEAYQTMVRKLISAS